MGNGDWLVQVVVCRGGSTPETTHFRSEMITIGRGPESDVVLEGDTVSRVHAVVFSDEDNQLVVRDVGSTNGLAVNDVRVAKKRVAPWDVVTIGEFEISFCLISSEGEIATNRDVLGA